MTKEKPAVGEMPGLKHRQKIQDLARELRGQLVDVSGGGPHTIPDDDMIRNMETLVVLIGSVDFSDSWTRRDWKLMRDAVSFCEKIREEQTAQRWPGGVPSGGRWSALEAVLEHAEKVVCPPDLAKPRIKQLETLAELTEQKVSDHQIALIFGWTDDDGHPDTSKVKLAKQGNGEIEVPTHVTLPSADHTQPVRRPHLGLCESLAEQILAARRTDHAAV